MGSLDSGDKMVASNSSGVHIKTEKYSSDEEKVFDINRDSYESNNSEDNSCMVKVEEEMMQFNAVAPYYCETCNATYDGLASYEVHIAENHGVHTTESPFACKFCDKGYKTKILLRMHSQIHISMNRSACLSGTNQKCNCEVCYSPYEKARKNRLHMMMINSVERPYVCDICSASFIKKRNLNDHKRIHTSERMYECLICTARFKSKKHLIPHMRGHTEEKAHKCDVCSSGFVRSSDLKRHKATHTNVTSVTQALSLSQNRDMF